MKAVRFLSCFAVRNAFIAYGIDPHFSCRMNDPVLVEQNAHVNNSARFIIEKSKVAFLSSM